MRRSTHEVWPFAAPPRSEMPSSRPLANRSRRDAHLGAVGLDELCGACAVEIGNRRAHEKEAGKPVHRPCFSNAHSPFIRWRGVPSG